MFDITKPLRTRGEREARVVCTDFHGKCAKNSSVYDNLLLTLVKDADGYETIQYNSRVNGKWIGTDKPDNLDTSPKVTIYDLVPVDGTEARNVLLDLSKPLMTSDGYDAVRYKDSTVRYYDVVSGTLQWVTVDKFGRFVTSHPGSRGTIWLRIVNKIMYEG